MTKAMMIKVVLGGIFQFLACVMSPAYGFDAPQAGFAQAESPAAAGTARIERADAARLTPFTTTHASFAFKAADKTAPDFAISYRSRTHTALGTSSHGISKTDHAVMVGFRLGF